MPRTNFNFQPGCSIRSSAPAVNELVRRLDEPRTSSLLDAYKIIPREKLRMNKKNNYPLNEMEKLEYLILHFGMIEDISVIYSTEEDVYIIESGHRRTTALDNLISKYRDWSGDTADPDFQLYEKNIHQYENGYVCKVLGKLSENIEYDISTESLDEVPASVIESEIRLIISNEGSRTTPPAVKAANIKRLAALLEHQNKDRSKGNRININEEIAFRLGITPRQVINYKNVEKLIPELHSLFEAGKISLKDSSSYARLDLQQQAEIYQQLTSPSKANASKLGKTNDRLSELNKQLLKLLNSLQKTYDEFQSVSKVYVQQFESNGRLSGSSNTSQLLSPDEFNEKLREILTSGEPGSLQ